MPIQLSLELGALKVCRVCGSDDITRARVQHRDYVCRTCTKVKIRTWESDHPDLVRTRQARNSRRYRAAYPEKALLSSAKTRARRENLPFNLTLSDIVIPERCPALGIPLERKIGKGGSDNSPSLDRVIPDRGYVRGNIAVISNKANRIKSNASLEDLSRVRDWLANTLREGT